MRLALYLNSGLTLNPKLRAYHVLQVVNLDSEQEHFQMAFRVPDRGNGPNIIPSMLLLLGIPVRELPFILPWRFTFGLGCHDIVKSNLRRRLQEGLCNLKLLFAVQGLCKHLLLLV